MQIRTRYPIKTTRERFELQSSIFSQMYVPKRVRVIHSMPVCALDTQTGEQRQRHKKSCL